MTIRHASKIIPALVAVFLLLGLGTLYLSGKALNAGTTAATAATAAREATIATEKGVDLANCRAQARGVYDQAQQFALDAQAQVNYSTNEGLAALASADQAKFLEVTSRSAGERRAALDAAHAASATQRDYQAKISQAIADPDQFLAECHRDAD